MTLTPAQAQRNRELQVRRDQRKRQRERDAKAAEARARRVVRQHDTDPRVQLFRAERDRRARETAQVVADAKREFDRYFDQKLNVGRGGRPRGQSILVGRDPANALVEALERQSR